jgi:hypothetical protein
VGDTPEQAAFHGSFKKRRAKQQVERYAPQEPALDSPRSDAAQHKGSETPRGKVCLWCHLLVPIFCFQSSTLNPQLLRIA